MNTLSKTVSLSATLILLLAGCSSQQQVSNEGASQVASSSQAQQVAEKDTCPSCNTPKVAPVVTAKPAVVASGHTHPANRCTKSIRHNHPNGNRSHSHKYSCGSAVRGNKWTHGHPANKCTKSVKHTHKHSGRHNHKYSCQGKAKSGGNSINVQALQRKLKAKGYYKGPINGVINTGTRAALQRYQQRRK